MGIVFSTLFGGTAKSVAPDETKTSMSELVNPEDCLVFTQSLECLKRGVLKSSTLVRWVDLSATLSMLKFLAITKSPIDYPVTRCIKFVDFSGPAYLGDIVELKAKLISVGNTSMNIEVVGIVTDSDTQESKVILKSIVTMVGLRLTLFGVKPAPAPRLILESEADLQKVEELKALNSASPMKKVDFGPETWQKFLKSEAISPPKDAIDPVSTRVETIKMPFPEHMNPGGFTFGGQIMAWMHDVVYLCGAKFAKRRCLISASIDEVNFLSPSTVKDLVRIRCQVNRVFNSSFVVGCRVDKISRSDPIIGTHICSAQFTFVAPDTKLPQVFPTTEEDQWRFYKATVRRGRKLSVAKKQA